MAPQDDPYSAISSEDVLATEPECIRSDLFAFVALHYCTWCTTALGVALTA